MTPGSSDPLARLAIPLEKKSARTGGSYALLLLILLLLLLLAGAALYSGNTNTPARRSTPAQATEQTPAPDPLPRGSAAAPAATPNPSFSPATNAPNKPLFTANGYVVPHQRIQLSARFPGTVAAIHVRKGDTVKRGQLLVALVDDEYRHRLEEAEGTLAKAKASLAKAEADLRRQEELTRTKSATDRDLDDARRAMESAQAEVTIAQGQLHLAQTKLDWCSIRSPVDGTVLDKHVEEHELIIPQGFGLPGTASTTLVTLADLSRLEVEVDVNELDTPKVRLDQPCRVIPVAYPDLAYTGQVVEVSPEANRQKGTLQVKVRIDHPDSKLVPELNARVEFLP